MVFRAVAGFFVDAGFRVAAGFASVALDVGAAAEVGALVVGAAVAGVAVAGFAAIVRFGTVVRFAVAVGAVLGVGAFAAVVRAVRRPVVGGETGSTLTGVMAPAAWTAAEPTRLAPVAPARLAADPTPLAAVPAAFAAEPAPRAAELTPVAAAAPAPLAADPAPLATEAAEAAVNRATLAASDATSVAASAACLWRLPICFRAFSADASWRSRFASVARAAARRFSSLRSSLAALFGLAIGSTSVQRRTARGPSYSKVGRPVETDRRQTASMPRSARTSK